jgi:eukaryotic-like serine/threonine-protein kinase
MSTDDRDLRATAERRVGQTLNDKWRIDRVIDLGAMAAVFAATHRNGKRVAIKMLHPSVAAKDNIRQRFLREGYVANKVQHRGAVQILDDDKTDDGGVFLVMELLDGESLERLMARAPGQRVPVHEVLGIADQVLDTLAAFHGQGVVHRDIKPANLVITREGVVKVLDFGLARLRDPAFGTPHTGQGTVMGTVAYMPPEQALGKSDDIDARSDIFAVGAVMFHMIVGAVFVKGKTPLERLFCAMRSPAPGLATCVPGIPSYVAEVVDKALAFDKGSRWADAGSMRSAVQSAYRALVADAKRAPKAPVASSAPRLPSASSLEARATGDSPAPLTDSILVEEGSVEMGASVPLEVSISDILENAALLARRKGTPPPLPTDFADASGTIYREVLVPSIVVDVSFSEDDADA